MSVLRGFNAGYNALDRYYQQEESKRRYDQQYKRQLGNDEMRAQTHAQGLVRGEQGIAINQNTIDRMPIVNGQQDDLAGLNIGNAQLRQQVNQNTVDQLPIANEAQGLQLDATRQQLSNAKQQGDMNQYTFDRAKKADANNDLMGAFTNTLSYTQQTKDPAKMAQFLASNDLKGTNLELLQDPANWDALSQVSKGLESGNMQMALQGFNTGYKAQLNKRVGTKGRDGGTIKDVSAVQIIPDENNPEQMRMKVRVLTDKGGYESFISDMRSSKEGDPVKMFDLNEMIGTGAAMGDLATMLKSSGYAQQFNQRAGQYAQGLQVGQSTQKPLWKDVKGEMGNTIGYFDPNTQQMVNIPMEDRMPGMSEDSVERENELIAQKKEERLSDMTADAAKELSTRGLPLRDDEINSIARKVAMDTLQNPSLVVDQHIETITASFIANRDEQRESRNQVMSESRMGTVSDMMQRGIY